VRFAIAVLLGFVLGWAGAHALFLGWWTLAPWGAAGLALGYWLRSTRPALAGAAYGFTLSFVFMATQYTGTASLVSRVPFFALLGGVGALCGLVLAVMGSRLRALVRPGMTAQ
jgi:hypothetical protein